MNGNKGTVSKAVATGCIWLLATVMIAIVSLFVGADAVGGILFVMIATIVSTGFVWNWGRSDGAQKRKPDADAFADSRYNMSEKRKNLDISRRLRDYSDDELVALRERVTRGEISEEELADLLG